MISFELLIGNSILPQDLRYVLFVAPYEGKNGHNRQIILGTSLKDFYESNVDFFEGLLYTRVCLSPSGKPMR